MRATLRTLCLAGCLCVGAVSANEKERRHLDESRGPRTRPTLPSTPAGQKGREERNVENWEEYNKDKKEAAPADTLLTALDEIKKEKRKGTLKAYDLGAGAGRDTLELLKRGWQVEAIDIAPKALKSIEDRAGDKKKNLKTQTVSFEAMKLEKESADLINASYSLPFAEPEKFKKVMEKVVGALKPGGRFAGQFFGVKDEWNDNDSRMTFLKDLDEVKALFPGFKFELAEEITPIRPGGGKEHKQWHIFNVIARKPDKAD